MGVPSVATISAGNDLDPTVFNAIISAIVTEMTAGLDNTNWSTAAGDKLAGTKVDIASNTTFLTEHSSAGAHTITSDSMKQWKFRFTSSLTTSASFIDITMLPATGTGAILASQTDTYAHTVAGIEETHTQAVTMSSVALNALDTGTVAASTDYYLYLIHDSSGTESTDAGFIWSEETSASSTFWANITAGIWTGGYTGYVAGPLAHVLTNADGDGILAYGCAGAVGDAPNAGTLQEKTWYDIIDMATVASDLSEDGYVHMTFGSTASSQEDGLVIQWGVTAGITANTNSTITFPFEFPNACFVTVPAFLSADDIEKPVSIQTAGTTTTVVFRNNGGDTVVVDWIAIGN